MGGRTWLVVEDGSIFSGKGFGSSAALIDEITSDSNTAIGEIVFNTAMSGYQEVLTDPSYTGQIVAMTYPHIGNYGIDTETYKEIESGPLPQQDRRPIKIAAFVIRDLYEGPVPKNRTKLSDYLSAHAISGISEVDTRALTLHIRKRGSARALLLRSQAEELSKTEKTLALRRLQEFPQMTGRNLLSMVGTQEELSDFYIKEYFAQNSIPKFSRNVIAVYDCGTKANIVRILTNLGCKVRVFPSTTSAQRILDSSVDALLLSNGPGDPTVLETQLTTIKKLIGNIPLFGICLGHQLIASALGAKIFKMKFGHHGINHPVRDERTGKVFVTSQNHGFAVLENSIPSTIELYFRNANDQTVEGLRDDNLAILTTQFHPESAPGPSDSEWIFTEFLQSIPNQQVINYARS